MLVDAGHLRRTNHSLLEDARRDDVWDRFAAAVFVDADGRDVEGGVVADVVGFIFSRRLDALCVGAPFALHEVKGGETQHDGAFEVGDEHPHEADGREVVDVADDLVGLPDGDAELVPGAAADGVVGQRDVFGMEDVGDVVFTDDHLVRVDVDDVLVVALRFAQGVVVVDVFGVGHRRVAGGVVFRLLDVGGRVAFRSRKVLVAFE